MISTKQAASVNSIGNSDFEKSFSNIARAVVNKNAPSLQQYELGFQLLDRAEDDTKAFGVLIYNVGEKILTVPLIFVGSELKGADTIYLQDDNLYLPLTEEWLNSLLSYYQKPIGAHRPRYKTQSGSNRPLMSEMYGLRRKIASEVEPAMPVGIRRQLLKKTAAAFYQKMSELASFGVDDCRKTLANSVNVISFLQKHATVNQVAAFERAIYSDPALTHWMKTRHSADKLVAAKTAAQRRAANLVLFPAPELEKRAAQITVSVVSYRGVMPKDADKQEQKELVNDGWAVLDKRSEAGKMRVVDTGALCQNPTATGIYNVLMPGGDFEQCLVVMRPITSATRGKTVLADGENCLVVRVESPHIYTYVSTQAVFVREGDQKATLDFLKDLPQLGSYTPDDERGCCFERICAISADAKNATGVFDMFNSGSKGELEGSFINCPASKPRTGGSKYDHLHAERRRDERTPLRAIYADAAGTIPRHDTEGVLLLPEDWRVLKLANEGNLRVGQLSFDTVFSGLGQKKVAISKANARFVVNNEVFQDAQSAARHLCCDLGLAGDEAKPLLKSAGLLPKTVILQPTDFNRTIAADVLQTPPKLAAITASDADIPRSYLTSPYRGGFSGEVQEDGERALQDPERFRDGRIEEGRYDLIRDEMQEAMPAAEAASLPEMVDLGGLKTLLQTSSEERIIDEELPKLTTAVDALSRLLLHLYIHTDVFVRRYGKAETKELEAGLRNNRDSAGKTLYQLKHRMSSANPVDKLIDQDLRDTTR